MLGPDHIETIHTMNNLANTLFALEKYDEALSLYEKLCVAYEKLLPPNHPDAIRAVDTLHGLFVRFLKLTRLYLRSRRSFIILNINTLSSKVHVIIKGRYSFAIFAVK